LNASQKEGSLLNKIGVKGGRRPIRMSSGYLIPFNESNVRQQVIIVVTDSYAVLCFDHNLKLLWESSILQYVPPSLYLSEIAIAVTSIPLRINDKGSVFIGGRFSLIPQPNTVEYVFICRPLMD
jgi:hypothetical protein